MAIYSNFNIATVDDNAAVLATQNLPLINGTYNNDIAIGNRVRVTFRVDFQTGDPAFDGAAFRVYLSIFGNSTLNIANSSYFKIGGFIGTFAGQQRFALIFEGNQSQRNYGGYVQILFGALGSATVVLYFLMPTDINNFLPNSGFDNKTRFTKPEINGTNLVNTLSPTNVYAGTRQITVQVVNVGVTTTYVTNTATNGRALSANIRGRWYNATAGGATTFGALKVAHTKTFSNSVAGTIVASATGVQNTSNSNPDLFLTTISNSVAPFDWNAFTFTMEGSGTASIGTNPTRARVTIFQTDGSGTDMNEVLDLEFATFVTDATSNVKYSQAPFINIGMNYATPLAIYAPTELTSVGTGNARIVTVRFRVRPNYFKANKSYRIAVQLFWGATQTNQTVHLSPVLIADKFTFVTSDNFIPTIYDQFNGKLDGYDAINATVHSRLQFGLKLSKASYNINAALIGANAVPTYNAGTFDSNIDNITATITSTDNSYIKSMPITTSNVVLNSDNYLDIVTSEIRLPNKAGDYYIDFAVNFLQILPNSTTTTVTQRFRYVVTARGYGDTPIALTMKQLLDAPYPTDKIQLTNYCSGENMCIIETEKAAVGDYLVAALFFNPSADLNPTAVNEEDNYTPAYLVQETASQIINNESSFVDSFHAYQVKNADIPIGATLYAGVIVRPDIVPLSEPLRALLIGNLIDIRVQRTATTYGFVFNKTALINALNTAGAVFGFSTDKIHPYNSTTVTSFALDTNSWVFTMPINEWTKVLYTYFLEVVYLGHVINIQLQYTFNLPTVVTPLYTIKQINNEILQIIDRTY